MDLLKAPQSLQTRYKYPPVIFFGNEEDLNYFL